MYEHSPTSSTPSKPHTRPTPSTPRELFLQWQDHARRGDLSSAWRISDQALEIYRSDRLTSFSRHSQGVWNGSPVEGRDVLVRCHHGLGDTIQFSRFIPRLRKIAGSVALLVQPDLVDPLSPLCHGVDIFSSDVVQYREFDVEIEIMELAHLFRIELNDIPNAVPYINADPIVVRSEGRLNVGVVWQAGDWDDRRSITYDSITAWTGIPGMQLFSLQKDPPAAGWRGDRVAILDASTIERTAGLMTSLDLVITVDTMTAHLAGALGRPVWTLLQADADWRWLEDRSDSPWYPTMRLFRQEAQGDWGPVIDSVGTELRQTMSQSHM